MLTIEHLSKTYPGGVRALDDVTLAIPKGMFGLLGPNGAGKSTLMRTLATLQPPDHGAIRLQSRDGMIDVLTEKERLRARLGYLPQDFGTYPRVSAEAMLDHLAVLKGVTDRAARRETVDRLLAATNLDDVRSRRLDQFSGGMRQRFGVAQALIGDPELIIVDEPTAGLDPTERRRFHNLLSHLGQEIVIVLSTHIVDDVADLCPRMAIMSGGRILADGEPERLIETLRGRLFTRQVDDDALERYRASSNVISSQLSAGRLSIRVCAEAAPDATFRAVEPDLEDVYFATIAAHGERLGDRPERRRDGAPA